LSFTEVPPAQLNCEAGPLDQMFGFSAFRVMGKRFINISLLLKAKIARIDSQKFAAQVYGRYATLELH
jgi:hypothetical protein